MFYKLFVSLTRLASSLSLLSILLFVCVLEEVGLFIFALLLLLPLLLVELSDGKFIGLFGETWYATGTFS